MPNCTIAWIGFMNHLPNGFGIKVTEEAKKWLNHICSCATKTYQMMKSGEFPRNEVVEQSFAALEKWQENKNLDRQDSNVVVILASNAIALQMLNDPICDKFTGSTFIDQR